MNSPDTIDIRREGRAMHRIDVHQHLVTENNPIFGMPDGLTWWSVDNALRVMDENEVRLAMLSPIPRLPANAAVIRCMEKLRAGPLGRTRLIRGQLRKGVRQANRMAAGVVEAHPDRFGFFANLGLTDADDAIAEADYAFDVLGADGVFMPTNIGSVYFGDEAFEPLFAELDRRHAVVFVHPIHLPCPVVSGIPAHVADFLLGTVRAAVNLVRRDVLGRYPRLRIILTHGGGFLPYAVQRFARLLAALDSGRSQDELSAEFRKFYFDVALSTSPGTLAALLGFAEDTHVLYGSDFPYNQPHDIEFFTDQLDNAGLDPQVLGRIDHANAEALFPRLRLG
jgi:6-methylsalicylate decarboxylase